MDNTLYALITNLVALRVFPGENVLDNIKYYLSSNGVIAMEWKGLVLGDNQIFLLQNLLELQGKLDSLHSSVR